MGGLITDPNRPTILERDWYPSERHRSGDHMGCGSACRYSGTDLRPAPLYDATVRALAAASRPSPRIEAATMATLRIVAQSWGVPGYRSMRKAQLVAALMSHPKYPTSAWA